MYTLELLTLEGIETLAVFDTIALATEYAMNLDDLEIIILDGSEIDLDNLMTSIFVISPIKYNPTF